MAIDTHTHIFNEAFDFDREEVINRIISNNIQKIVLVGFSKETNKQTLELSSKYSFIYPTVGYHPSEANEINDNDLIELENIIKGNKVYAIGECGLDYYWVKDNKDAQKKLFKVQLDLSLKYDLPVVIHCRDAINDVYEILKEYDGKVKFVMHCYSGSKEMALEFLKLGGYISLGGPVTFKNSKEPKEVAKIVPIDKLLIETDCPYLTPHPYRGKRNEPSHVRLVLSEIASLREMDEQELEKTLDNNSISFFKLD